MRHFIVILFCLASNADKPFVSGPKPSFSKQEAVEQCEEEGAKLASYREIKANPSASEYLNELDKGETAWIEGYAKLSLFLTWQGCFTTKDLRISIRTVAINFESVYICINTCNGFQFIGLKGRSCYCIDQYQRDKIQYASVNDSFCSTPCANNAVDSCGGHSYMSVYGILDDGRIHWANDEPNSQLCVYVKRSERYWDRFDAYTASCQTLHTLQPGLIHGYICTNSVWSRLSANDCNQLTSTQGTYCIKEDTVTRQEASVGCFRMNGILADLGAENTAPALLNYNFSYWLGVHRTFQVADKYNGAETVCLSVTRLGNMLYLEPDRCSSHKYFLCESNSIGTIDTTLSGSLVTRKTELTNRTFIPTTFPFAKPTDTNFESPIIYIVPSVLVVVFFVLAVSFVIYRRRKKHRVGPPEPLPDNYDAVDDIENIPYELSVSFEHSQNMDSKCLIAKAKPDKPERQTMKRKMLMNEYENFSPKYKDGLEETKKRTGKSNEDKSSEYDRLKFESMPRNIKLAAEGYNIYNHMNGTDNEAYDTMKSIKSLHSLGQVDATYSHMNRSKLDDLGSPNNTENVHDSNKITDITTFSLRSKEVDTKVDANKSERTEVTDEEEIISPTESTVDKREESLHYVDITHSPEEVNNDTAIRRASVKEDTSLP